MALLNQHSCRPPDSLSRPNDDEDGHSKNGYFSITRRVWRRRKTASDVIEEARASLQNPTRPFTPMADPRRRSDLVRDEVPRTRRSPRRSVLIARTHIGPPVWPRKLQPICSSGSEGGTDIPAITCPDEDLNGADCQPDEYLDDGVEEHRKVSVPTPSQNSPEHYLASAHMDCQEGPDLGNDTEWSSLRDLLRNMLQATEADFRTYYDALWAALSADGWFSQGADRKNVRKRREHTLQAIIEWMNSTGKPENAVAGCSIVLKLTRNERILKYACKLLYKLSQNEHNDPIFKSFPVLDTLPEFLATTAYPSDQANSSLTPVKCNLMLLVVGTLRNVSASDDIAKRISEFGGARELCGLIWGIMEADPRGLPDEVYNVIIQLTTQTTATLRNLLTSHEQCKIFLDHTRDVRLINILIRALDNESGLSDSEDVILNICRILSKLSLHPECLPHLGGRSSTHFFLHILIKYQAEKRKPQALLTRVCFILGNLTNKLSENHAHLRAGIADLVALFGVYASVELGTETDEADEDDPQDVGLPENEEVLVKLIRLLANLAIDEKAGKAIVAMIEIEDLVHLLHCKPVAQHSELVLNIVGAVANFTYYHTPENCILRMRINVAEEMIKFLLQPNPEMVVEAARVLANLSRYPDVRSIMARKRGTETLTILLDHTDREVVLQVCGCLMNLGSGATSTDEHSVIVVENGGLNKLVEVIFHSLNGFDYPLAISALKTLYNLCSSAPARIMSEDVVMNLESSILDVLEKQDQKEPDNSAERFDLDEVADQLLNVLEDRRRPAKAFVGGIIAVEDCE
ncbi:armadillo-type protein [Fimicolochytrium jonesii]|uniref:armadillo-type protein n=1 Tax=Fimicolochytrium jonesii TaxID=1396493 RepID=UPI0022FECA12|nr:armadillo-type protein [Fimicolochytrium jonesii]KAI8818652.1 armadillo-type protein [Fimicolochytrium jonesii]